MKNDINMAFNELLNDIKTICFMFCFSEGLTDKYDNSEEKFYEEVIYDLHMGNYIISEQYNIFYAQACRLLNVVLPERLEEFKSCYMFNKKGTAKVAYKTISDYFHRSGVTEKYSGYTHESFVEHTYQLLNQQKNILKSAEEILDSVLYNIENLIQYDFYKDELNATEDLLKKKYTRVAGVVASVVYERHLKNVCENNPNIKTSKNDSLGKYIQHLRGVNVIDAIDKRKQQCLADIRNLCCHAKDREPSELEVQNLIIGVRQVLVDLN